MENETIVQFNFKNTDGMGTDYCPLVRINVSLDAEKLKEIEDAIMSYIDDMEDWQFDDLINDVMESFGYSYDYISPVRTFNI